jgi:hypothetical protein
MSVFALHARAATFSCSIAVLTLLLASVACGQLPGDITTASVEIGGIGAKSCYEPAFDPPTLSDGTTIAKGAIDLVYDSHEAILTLTVHNLSPEVPGEPTPVIREIYINMPQGGAVPGAFLISQSSPGLVQPNFTLTFDPVTSDGGPLSGGCFGRWNMRLRDPGTIEGSIAAIADVLPGPPGTMVTTPAVFQIALLPTTSGAQSIRASTFPNVTSYPGPENMQAQSLFKFEGAPGVTGFVTNKPVGGPAGPAAGWVVGNVFPGSLVDLVATGLPGAHTYLVVSTDPGPITVGGYTFPIGAVHYILIQDTVIPQAGWTSVSVQIPTAIPEVTQVPVYGIVVNTDFNFRVVSLSEQFSLEVEF